MIRHALPFPRPRDASAYLALLGRRLRALGRGGSIPASRAEHALARRFLKPLVGTWDDGDEELVRGMLDRWVRPGEDPLRSRVRSLTEAARLLAGIRVRPGTLWFFLWEMESILLEFPPPVSPTPPRRS